MTADHDFLDNLANHQHQKMLREIANDDLTPKKTRQGTGKHTKYAASSRNNTKKKYRGQGK